MEQSNFLTIMYTFIAFYRVQHIPPVGTIAKLGLFLLIGCT